MIEHHFRTTFPVKKTERLLSYPESVALIGSCFTENIGKRLSDRRFSVNINPSGIIYNPVSIARTIEEILGSRQYDEQDVHQHENKWFSYHHHSRFSHPDKSTCLELINREMKAATEFYKNAGYLIITFGTAWIYELAGTGEIVANCHKIPRKAFRKRLLEPHEIVTTLEPVLAKFKSNLPELQICFTLSPVRHVRDGVEEDRLSKSILRYAIHQLVETGKGYYYFPAYELLTDDLRDYRFYARDLVHPDEVATDYIWEHFREACISPDAHPLMIELEKLNAAVSHRPLFPGSTSHADFKAKQLALIDQLETNYPFLQLDDLREQL